MLQPRLRWAPRRVAAATVVPQQWHCRFDSQTAANGSSASAVVGEAARRQRALGRVHAGTELCEACAQLAQTLVYEPACSAQEHVLVPRPCLAASAMYRHFTSAHTYSDTSRAASVIIPVGARVVTMIVTCVARVVCAEVM